MKKIGNEIKTGVMLVACILILLWLTAKTGGMSTFKKGYELKARFNYISGVKKGAPVYLTGVEAGEVKDVLINYSDEGTSVLLTLWMDKSAKPRKDSKALIATMGLMGEKYIEMTRGSRESQFLEPGDLIVGKEPMAMEEIMDKATEIADNLNAGIGDLRTLTKNVNLTVSDNKGQIDGIISNMNETSKNFKEFSDEIKRNPWKLLVKTKEKKEEAPAEKDKKGKGGYFYKKGE